MDNPTPITDAFENRLSHIPYDGKDYDRVLKHARRMERIIHFLLSDEYASDRVSAIIDWNKMKEEAKQ